MKKQPQISVIIPVYRVEKYLSECLNSVLGQTFQDFEVVCINDGSPDNCDKILSFYAGRDKRIKVFKQQNQGLSGARNTGLDKATGKYVFFLDSDDTIPSYALSTLFQIIETTGVPLVCSRFFLRGTNDPLYSSYTIHQGLRDFVADKRIFSSACNKLYSAEILKKHRFIRGIYFEDWPFLMCLMGGIDRFVTTNVPCYTYREEGSSITRSSFNQRKVDSYLVGVDTVYHYYQNRPDLRLAQIRMAIAIKMMINKVYKSKNKKLYTYTLSALSSLFAKGVVHKSQLSLKARFRLWKMSHKTRI